MKGESVKLNLLNQKKKTLNVHKVWQNTKRAHTKKNEKNKKRKKKKLK